MRTQPRKNITQVAKYRAPYGNEVRIGYQDTIFDKSTVFPKPLEYDDIDRAMFDFVDNSIGMSVDGKTVPTYTLFSNQRFSEYTQMWEHCDENGNLYLNFKTINRDKNPSTGDNQGGLWNIPGNRRYTLFRKDVVESDGSESIELYTMKQPYSVDLSYTISFVTVTMESLNSFNEKVNKLFSARQQYIRPNGHYIPMVIDEISDETSYSISDRKFYVQSVTVKVMAYIIEKGDFEVTKYPKSRNVKFGDENFSKKPCVEINEYDNPMKNTTIEVSVTFQPYHGKVEFDFDTEMVVEKIDTKNVKNIRVMINDTLYYTEKGFTMHDGDSVRIKITPFKYDDESSITLVGYNPTEFYDSSVVPEKVSDEKVTHEEIKVE